MPREDTEGAYYHNGAADLIETVSNAVQAIEIKVK